jgi:sec-independent protein translocase protein TatC
LSEYVNFYIYIFYNLTLFFQIIHSGIILTYFSHIEQSVIKKFRKILYYLLIILSTLLVPSDILTQFSLSIFLMGVIEILILLNLFKNSKINLMGQVIKTY